VSDILGIIVTQSYTEKAIHVINGGERTTEGCFNVLWLFAWIESLGFDEQYRHHGIKKRVPTERKVTA
jgi:hypothetical protein